MNDKPAVHDEGSGSNARERFLVTIQRGFLSGFSTSVILVKVMVPTIALVWILKLGGVLDVIAAWAAPFMKVFHLPGEASLVLITGGLINVYAAIAAAVNIPLTGQEMTVLAIMVLIAHNLPVETVVQKQAGTPIVIMLPARLGGAMAAGLLFSRVIPAAGAPSIRTANLNMEESWGRVLAGNAASLLKIVVIVIGLMIAMELMREYGVMDRVTVMLQAPMKVLGMNAGTSFVAAVGLLLGIAYGAGIIISETNRSAIGSREILATNLFLGFNHALVEDSLIFAAVGASLGWIVLGRLAFGIILLRLAMPIVLYLWKPGRDCI